MPTQYSDMTDIFEKVADSLELEGENSLRVRAYRDATRTVGGHSRSVAEMVEKDENLTSLSGIGEDLAGKIREIVERPASSPRRSSWRSRQLGKQIDPEQLIWCEKEGVPRDLHPLRHATGRRRRTFPGCQDRGDGA
jgi:DNA polymerase/3'-5' exonuclease PolX